MGRLVLLTAGVALIGLVGGTAHAGFTPAWSYVPAAVRAQLAARQGGSLYLPARTPLHYRYRSGAKVSGGTLTVLFRNRVRIRAGVWRWTGKTFRWLVRPLASHRACRSWGAVDRTLQLGGNRVYWSAGLDGGTAWRCVVDARGRSRVLAASEGGALPDTALGMVVASGLDVARRAPVRVSLATTPTTVRRGRLVLVHGTAGRCPAGDQVTVISRAFAATHTFAGVPAAFAPVGAAGRFSVRVRVPAARAPGHYVLTARCGGGNLGLVAHLTVTR